MIFKRKRLLFLIFILAPSFLAALPVTKYQFSSTVYGPFSLYHENQNLVISVSSTSLLNQEVYGQITILNENNQSISQSKSNNVVISKYQTKTMIISLLTQFFLGSDGMKVVFNLIDANNSNVLVTSKFDIYPTKVETFDPTDYSQSEISLFSTCFEFVNSGVVAHQEQFIFDDFLDYFLIDTYYRLLISQYRFRYQFFSELIYENAYLILPDIFATFSSISPNDLGQIIIPLFLSKEEQNYVIKFPENMFVNPKTLEMSLTPKDEYLNTKYFYLPPNHLKDLHGTEFTFVIKGLGANQLTFLWTTSFLAYQGLIGSCADSDYCVIGGIVS